MTSSQHVPVAAPSAAVHDGSTVSHGLTAATATSLAEVASLEADWLDLYKRHGLLSPWAHPGRFEAEVRVSPTGDQPLVVIFRDEDGPRAAIVARTLWTRLRFHLGYWKVRLLRVRILHIVHGGLISDGTPQAQQAILEHLHGLLQTRQVHAISVNHMPVNHELREALLAAGAVAGVAEPHWRFQLVPGSFEQTSAVFTSKHRREMRRMDRVLTERFGGQVVLRRFEKPEELPEMIRGSAAIAARTYQAGMGVGFADEQPWQEILASDARGGRLRGYWLECRGEPIAFQIGTILEKTYFMDFMGYLPEYASLGAGSVLHGRVLQDLCADGMCGVDYGFGHADYKKTYGTESREEATLVLYGSGARARAACSLAGWSDWLSHTASRCAARLGVRTWLKRTWRARLQAQAATAGPQETSRPVATGGRLRRVLRKHGLRGTLRLAASKGYVRLFGREALRQYQQQEEAFDQTHRIDTAGRIPLAVLDADSPHARFGNAYQPTSPELFGEILASLEIAHERFVFVDFGSGKGRVVLLASQVPFRKVVGVEFSSQLHRVAQQNLERFAAEKRRCGSIELLCMDATQYPIPDEDAVLYFYNPFEQQVMDIVLANLQASLARRPRTIYLVLVNVGYPVAPAGFVSVPAHTGYKKVVILKSP